MFIAYIVVAILLTLVLAGSGRGKLVRDPKIMEGMTKVGVPESWLPRLAALEFAGAIGLIAGIWVRALGVAAAVGVVLYFIGAVATHLRAKDGKGAPVPGALALLAVAATVLGLATL
ncbi:DoxX family protein [Kitasatospora acidiphila]|uniref:DoxX family protein n=1 Tax=Kitasatospora acidiphila TaxID=2567942 RepID=A0A540WC16_9ACTN|nr:DoxX family protein [Kitasatospora acidiphila]TQF06591.1 DoxX family protein [Kitasatospora acidiphila]